MTTTGIMCPSSYFMYVTAHPDASPVASGQAHKYLGGLRSCLAVNSLLEEPFVMRHPLSFMTAYSKTLTVRHTCLPLQSLKSYHAIKHPTEESILILVSLTGCLLWGVKGTTPTCTSLKPLTPPPQTGTKHRKHSYQPKF